MYLTEYIRTPLFKLYEVLSVFFVKIMVHYISMFV